MSTLDRFVDAQRAPWAAALAELTAGRKTSHWMWFIFPQIAGLGRSETAQYFAIADLDEARAYLAHPLLGGRLVTATEAVLAHAGQPIAAILGEIDALKLASSMTLFDRAAIDRVGPERTGPERAGSERAGSEPDRLERAGDHRAPFAACLEAFFGGRRDPLTLALTDGAPRA